MSCSERSNACARTCGNLSRNALTDSSKAASLLASMRMERHPAALAVPASATAKTPTARFSAEVLLISAMDDPGPWTKK
jgi:hypothetical protein